MANFYRITEAVSIKEIVAVPTLKVAAIIPTGDICLITYTGKETFKQDNLCFCKMYEYLDDGITPKDGYAWIKEVDLLVIGEL